jgi:hypothetical protein
MLSFAMFIMAIKARTYDNSGSTLETHGSTRHNHTKGSNRTPFGPRASHSKECIIERREGLGRDLIAKLSTNSDQ